MAKNGKIPLGMMIGLYGTVKQAWDYKKYLDGSSYTDAQKTNAWIAKVTGYNAETGEFLGFGSPIGFWGPMAIGYGVSKYVGGKDKNGNGLNLNSKLRAIPMFKI